MRTEEGSQPPRRLERLDARIPEWEMSALEQRVCPFCGARGEPLLVRPDRLTVKICVHCDCRFVSPAPSAAVLASFYATYFSDHGHASIASSARGTDRVPTADLRINELRSLGQWEGKAALDVGCGPGVFLGHLQGLGMTVAGVDLDPSAVAVAKRCLGTDSIMYGGIEVLRDAPTFDLITMNDFIEHPRAPMEILKRATRLLRSGGHLLLFTPNGAYSDPRYPQDVVFRRDLEHMQYLTTRTMTFIARRLDLEMVHLETCLDPMGLNVLTTAPSSVRNKVTARAKAVVRELPGFSFAQRVRGALQPDERIGSYCVLAILRGPS